MSLRESARDRTLQTICASLGVPEGVAFVRDTVKAGYAEFFDDKRNDACAMVDEAFDALEHSQGILANPAKLVDAASRLLKHTFRKDDPAFWFNEVYHRYKTQIKPETDFNQLHKLIRGNRVLDYGCGSGYLAARLAKGGYTVYTTDVLDYRYSEAKHLPFLPMTSATDIPYPDDSIDTALVQAVLHHVDAGDLPRVIQRLAKMARHLVIKEDTYDVPGDLDRLAELIAAQPLLRRFVALPLEVQFQSLVLIDFYANAIAQGLPEMNMPFEFKTIPEWRELLHVNGIEVRGTFLAGFEPGRMHKSCHVWFVCERIA